MIGGKFQGYYTTYQRRNMNLPIGLYRNDLQVNVDNTENINILLRSA
jgi:hypothetical protein